MMKDGLLGAVDDEQRKWIGRVVENGQGLVNLVSDFLDVSKLEAGRIELAKEWIDLQRFLTACLDNYRIAAQEKRISLSETIDASTKWIWADPRRLEQVLSNLISNALKFTPNDGRIELGAAQTSNEIAVWVKDTGPGVPAEEIDQLFEKYRQTTSGKTSEQKGTGLGLVICKMIVEAHGGRIWVESPEGAGAGFFFTLPHSF
jgi:signal transduction histidine kinase